MTGGKRCGAPLRKKPGKTCRSRYVYQNGRCKLHGGASLAGVAAPNWKHGRFSNRFPVGWGSLDDRAADPNLRSIVLDLVVLDQRMGDILDRVGQLKGDAAKARAMEEYRDLAEARSRLIDAESRRMERGQSSIPQAQATLLIRSLSIAVKEEAETSGLVTDPKAFLARLSLRFDRLMGRSRLRVIQATADPVGPPAGEP